MSHYCGIDLHSNNHVVVVIDDEDKRVFEKRLHNDLLLTLEALAPYQNTLWNRPSTGTGWSMGCRNRGTTYGWSILLR